MTRRLLFDQNLAPRLVDRVAAEFPGSLHVRDLGLQAAADVEVAIRRLEVLDGRFPSRALGLTME